MTFVPPIDPGELYRVLAGSATDAIVTIDEDSLVLSINPAGERLFGYAESELLGQSLTMLMPERYRDRHRAGMKRYLATHQRRIPWQAVAVAILNKAGSEVPVEISFGEFVAEGRHIFSAIIRDVSDRMAAEALLATNAEQLQGQAIELEQQVEEAQAVAEELEQANEDLYEKNLALEEARAQAEDTATRLREQETEYRALANSIPTLAWMAQPDGWIFWYNDRWYEYTGTIAADMEGWGWQQVHHPDTLSEVLEQWTRSIETGEPFEMTFPLRGADGEFRPFLTRVFPLRDAAKKVVRWFGTNTDVSHEHAARVAAERAMERTRQLQQLTSLLAGASTLEDIAFVMVHQAVDATGAVTGMLALRDGESGDAVMMGEEGLPGSLKADYLRFPITRDSPTAECLRTNAPIYIGRRDGPDGLLARYPGLRGVWDSVGRSAVASLPIRIDGEAIAAMSFTFADPQAFTDEQREFFSTLAAQAAQGIARVWAFDAERRERRRSESIVEAITDGFVSFDSELRFQYVNARAASMFGISPADLQGREVTALPHSNESPFVSLLHRVMSQKAPAELEAYGTITARWLAMRAYPADDGGVIAYFQDVTDQRRRQDASSFLAEASRLLASSRDYETTLQRVARAAIPRLGDWCAVDLAEYTDRDDLPHLRRIALVHDDPSKVAVAEQYRRLYPPDLREGRSNGTARALAGESILVREVTEEMLVAGAKEPKQLAMLRSLGLGSIMIVPLSVAGQVLGTLTFCTGASGRPYDEVDKYLAEDLASRAANAIEHARLLQRAEAANAAKAEFLRTISHELRQPLNAMGGLLQLWELGLRGTLTVEQQEDLARIKRNQHQLSTLIEDLLSFARLEAGKLEVKRVAVALESVLEGLTAALGVDFDSRGINYRSVAPPPSLYALGDADRLHQVLVNLVTNAMKATSKGDLVEVTCAAVGDRVELRVRDTGTGIPAENLQSIFTPFVQVGRALNQPLQGAGLGLAISRGLVEAMGGMLTVESTLGEGSTFTVSLERADPVTPPSPV